MYLFMKVIELRTPSLVLHLFWTGEQAGKPAETIDP